MSNYKILNPRQTFKTCIPSSNKENFIIDAFVHVIILCIVLSIFFFAVISPLEKDNLQSEIDNQIDDGLKDSINSLDPQNKQTVKDTITNNEELLKKIKKLYDNPSDEVILYNQSITNINITIIISLILILITISVILKLSCNKCVSLGKMVVENLFLFSMIGIMEYLFFVNIAMNYIPVKPSYMKTIIVDKLNKL